MHEFIVSLKSILFYEIRPLSSICVFLIGCQNVLVCPPFYSLVWIFNKHSSCVHTNNDIARIV